MLRRMFHLVTATGIALGLMLVATVPAHASGFEWDYTKDTGIWVNLGKHCSARYYPNYGGACFEPDGDYVQPSDSEKDGYRVAARWKTDYGRHGICVDKGGFDAVPSEQGEYKGRDTCNKNMKEGSHVKVKVGRCDMDKRNCHNLDNWYAWSNWTRWIKV